MSRELMISRVQPQEQMEEPTELTPQDYVAILRRRKSLIIYVALTISILALIYALVAPKTYQATAKILIDPPTMTLSDVDANDPLSSLFNIGQQQTVDTQVQELQTTPLLESTAATAGNAKLTVAQVDSTNIIAVTAASNSARTAADAANTLVELYMTENLHNDQQDILAAKNFAITQRSLARQTLDSASAGLLKFRSTHNVTDLGKEQEYIQSQFGDLRTGLQAAHDDLSASQAQERSLRQQLATEPESIESHLVGSNTDVATLAAQLSQDEIQRQRLTQPGGFTAQAPQIIALDGEIKALNKRINQEPVVTTTISSTHNTVWDGLKTALSAAVMSSQASEARIVTLDQQIKDLKSKLQQFSALETPYDRLQRQYDEAAEADTLFTQKITELDLRLQARHSAAHIIEPARVPNFPVYPKRPLIVIFGAIMGLFMGLLCALGAEMFDDRLNSPADVERALRLPALGRIPVFTSDDLQMLAKMTGRRPEMESYKTLRTNLYFCSVDLPVKSLLITSAAPKEGKTTTSINLAFAIAADNKEVILVDTDLRLPSIHKVLGIPICPGLTDLLLGNSSLDDVLLDIPGVPNLKVITAGTIPPNPSELLNSQKFKMLMDELTNRVDMVICDGAPVLAVADSQIVSSLVDATMLVVSNGETRKASATHARHLLARARANVVGIAYNKSNSNEAGYYYYQYSAQPEQLEAGLNGHRPALTSTEIPKK